MDPTDTDNIVIVGGGAGGLELACKLGRKFGAQRVTLVDRNFYHVWKPSLHEVATGTIDLHQKALSYTMLAHRNRFTFLFGAFTCLDAVRKTIVVTAVEDTPGDVAIPERTLAFSRLCIAVGGIANYFDASGAAEPTISLGSAADAQAFRMDMLKKMTWAQHRKGRRHAGTVSVVIVGGGASGVELAAELREASKRYIEHGLRQLDPVKTISITLIESAARILPLLPERISAAAAMLEACSSTVIPGGGVAEVGERWVRDTTGRQLPHHIWVWAAGIKALRFVAALGLPVNNLGQLGVADRFNMRGYARIYALGDCTSCMTQDGNKVPPRAGRALAGRLSVPVVRARRPRTRSCTGITARCSRSHDEANGRTAGDVDMPGRVPHDDDLVGTCCQGRRCAAETGGLGSWGGHGRETGGADARGNDRGKKQGVFHDASISTDCVRCAHTAGDRQATALCRHPLNTVNQ
jgi:NADH dehydrogenase